MSKAPLDFHFDFVSPYAYLGWTQIHALAGRHGREVRPVPTLFAALLQSSGTLGPAEIPNKRVYIFKDVLRIAALLGVKVEPPRSHPFNPLLALRVAGLPMEPDARRRVVDALYGAVWGGGGGLESREDVARALGGAGFDGEAMLARAAEQEAKERLRTATDRAIAAGVFGVPTVVADGEVFWGCDSFPHLERFLEGKDPVAGHDMSRYLSIKASATRRR
jgi:2-hydroxychromene-2-carboxylate isomerase